MPAGKRPPGEDAEEARRNEFEAEGELRGERAGQGLEYLEGAGPETGEIEGDPFRRLVEGYKEFVEYGPLDANIHLQYGRQFLQVNLYDWAVQAFERAVKIAPGWADAHYYHAKALFEAGRMDEAEAGYAEARRLDPKLFEARVEQELLKIKRAKVSSN